MRNYKERKRLDIARKKSKEGDKKEKVNLYGFGRREFLQFENGDLVKYNLMKWCGKEMELSHEEQQGMFAFRG